MSKIDDVSIKFKFNSFLLLLAVNIIFITKLVSKDGFLALFSKNTLIESIYGIAVLIAMMMVFPLVLMLFGFFEKKNRSKNGIITAFFIGQIINFIYLLFFY
jgi:hypothetical protein